ncbi:MAG: hypothetical protein JSW06_02330 [Thermoplasmatales archaeon]|nr:MAG: hypothetical protein JSW06_02330 [Thermoplasmatales archaeon]
MKKITVHYECNYCKLKAKVIVETNKYGFFEIPKYYCPNDMSLVVGNVERFTRRNRGLRMDDNIGKYTLEQIKALAWTDINHLPLDVQDAVHTWEKYGDKNENNQNPI